MPLLAVAVAGRQLTDRVAAIRRQAPQVRRIGGAVLIIMAVVISDGFVVVGVHTPEFAFEHVVSNVRAQAAALGVHYPVAVDDDYGTWNAYDNEYWPADYLIDAQGNVRHVSFGEGGYSTTETLIRQLLSAAHPGTALPAPTDIANLTPTGEMSPETYVGYDRLQYLDPANVVHNSPANYHIPSTRPARPAAESCCCTPHQAWKRTALPLADFHLPLIYSRLIPPCPCVERACLYDDLVPVITDVRKDA